MTFFAGETWLWRVAELVTGFLPVPNRTALKLEGNQMQHNQQSPFWNIYILGPRQCFSGQDCVLIASPSGRKDFHTSYKLVAGFPLEDWSSLTIKGAFAVKMKWLINRTAGCRQSFTTSAGREEIVRRRDAPISTAISGIGIDSEWSKITSWYYNTDNNCVCVYLTIVFAFVLQWNLWESWKRCFQITPQ